MAGAPHRAISIVLALALLATAPARLAVAPGADAASRAPVRGARGMVVSVSDIASQVGVDVLRHGGNAVDAAVAVGLALAVVWPSAGNLGGGGFMLVRLADGRTAAIDYREMAPAAAFHDVYLRADGTPDTTASRYGPRASGVPGTVAGLAYAQRKYGTRPWAELVEPARRLAAEGFPVGRRLRLSLLGDSANLSRFPGARRIFLRDGRPYEEGEVFRQPELAATLGRLKLRGADDFYRGRTAQLIVAAMKSAGGWITAGDLAAYRAVERRPLTGTYRGVEIVTMPPPSSGGVVLLEMLHMLERYDLKGMGYGSSWALHLMIEAMRRAYADRAEFLGDPDFVHVPVAALTSRRYADQRAADISLTRASSSRTVGHGEPARYESEQTTHFTIADRWGNVVANTYTLNDSYGSRFTIEGAGFLMNDEMDDFAAKPGTPNRYGLVQSEANAVQPRKRPLSSMTPTIVLKDGRPWFALGSPGGGIIINAVMQVIINVVDHGMNLQQAVDAPRIHHQWLPDSLDYEPYGLAPDTRTALERMGHVFKAAPRTLG
ncbi:MAG: gamma-glutamyltransferase, partial [Candidatus Eisenbacteria bacterium]